MKGGGLTVHLHGWPYELQKEDFPTTVLTAPATKKLPVSVATPVARTGAGERAETFI